MTDEELTTRICELLGTIPGWAWRTAGPGYTAAEVGVFYGAIGAKPDRAVGVRIYGIGDDPETGLQTRSAQLRFRGAPRVENDADVLAGQAFQRLHMLTRHTGISLATRRSFSPLGADKSAREERADNYQIILDNPEASS